MAIRVPLFAALLAGALWTVPASAGDRDSVFVNNVSGSMVDMSVLDSGRTPYPVIYSRGKHYLAGEMGQSYVIRLTNRSPSRVLAVVSVDGVNVITGQTAAVSQAGYVLLPYGQTEIEGWRKSMHGVASFEFSHQATSYASRTGRPANVGVIGVAVFDEARPRPALAPSTPPSIASDQARGAMEKSAPQSASHPSPSLGTGHGDPLRSLAHVADFKRARHLPIQVSRLEYDSRRNLEYRGLWPIDRELQPFPGFVPDPWQ